MNHDISNFQITTGASHLNPNLCNFMYGLQPGAANVCDQNKDHTGPHRDSRTGVSWTNTLSFTVTSATAANR